MVEVAHVGSAGSVAGERVELELQRVPRPKARADEDLHGGAAGRAGEAVQVRLELRHNVL